MRRRTLEGRKLAKVWRCGTWDGLWTDVKGWKREKDQLGLNLGKMTRTISRAVGILDKRVVFIPRMQTTVLTNPLRWFRHTRPPGEFLR